MRPYTHWILHQQIGVSIFSIFLSITVVIFNFFLLFIMIDFAVSGPFFIVILSDKMIHYLIFPIIFIGFNIAMITSYQLFSWFFIILLFICNYFYYFFNREIL
jgi:hypothetical protein